MDFELLLQICQYISLTLFTYLAIKQKTYSWLFWMIFLLAFGYLLHYKHMGEMIMMQLVYFVLGLYYWIKWIRLDIKVKRLAGSQHLIINMVALCLLAVKVALRTRLDDFGLQYDEDLTLFLINLYTLIILYLIGNKIMSAWVYVGIVNFAGVFYFFYHSYYFALLYCLVITGLSIYGYISWYEESKGEEDSDLAD
ncbi:nicotinamide mononucleotide transporter [Aureibacter tunicatorum]|uniref:Nicotinamide mononucleotide transporter n=1 Tax=Aureibacter tunicatorum TaxID=866807 RepID=A0AAE4BP38_9BACT|nr:nicotinamide mononucleotide transporter [Aureibacter tunicatorum]MDR6237519.1 hypothetical protein [Aureibacter tunicatorum]BDD02553.1 hypothetical protein AUTU_00360 [Aureibacter tunicatorum]